MAIECPTPRVTYPMAQSLYEEGLAIARERADRVRIAILVNNLGYVTFSAERAHAPARAPSPGLLSARASRLSCLSVMIASIACQFTVICRGRTASPRDAGPNL